MELYPWVDENGVVFYSSSKDCSEMLDIWVNRNGELYSKITCSKDRVTTLTLGKIELPNDIKKLGKKIFRSGSTKWLANNIETGSVLLRFGSGDTFNLSFKLLGRSIQRKGKFRI